MFQQDISEGLGSGAGSNGNVPEDVVKEELSLADKLYKYTIRRANETICADLDEYDFFVRRFLEQYGFKYRRDKQ